MAVNHEQVNDDWKKQRCGFYGMEQVILYGTRKIAMK
jgi:hypothetical protein